MKKFMLAAALLLTTISVQAGVYLDLGASYIDNLDLIERASVTYGDYTISAERTVELEVSDWAGMARIGYEHSSWHFEYESMGIPKYHFERVNVYYRFNF